MILDEKIKEMYELLNKNRYYLDRDFGDSISDFLVDLQNDYIIIDKKRFEEVVKRNLTIKDHEFIRDVKVLGFELGFRMNIYNKDLENKEMVRNVMVEKVINDIEKI